MTKYAPLTDLEPVISILSRISFLGGVTDEQREEIFALMETGSFRKGEMISRRGEEASHIFIIRKGSVDLLILDNDVTVSKRSFQVGDCFGEAALLAMNNNTASFVAAEDCELIVFSKKALGRLRRENLSLFCVLIVNLARELARKLQYTDEMLLKYRHAQAV